MRTVLILGTGTGGTLVANLLAGWFPTEMMGNELRVLVLGENDDHCFQPANLDVAFKGADPKQSVREEASLLKPGVQLLTEGAERVDFATKRVMTRKGTVFHYDYLVIATGARAVPEAMPGLAEGSLNFHTGPAAAEKVWRALQSFDRGTVVVAITSTPYKCPPSPDEACFMLDEHFRKRGIRDAVKIKLLTPYPRAYPAQLVSDVVQPILQTRGVEVVPFFMVDHVDPAKKAIYNTEGEGVPYDLLIAIPPHRGAKVIVDSKIGDEEGWVPTDKHTMKVEGHPEVYAIGDATNISISKSGVVAHLQAETVASSIASALRGRQAVFEYNGRINCPMETGHHRALFVSATYASPPAKQSPTMLRYAMKREFAKIYWSTVQGGWSWLMDAYFGETSEPLGTVE